MSPQNVRTLNKYELLLKKYGSIYQYGSHQALFTITKTINHDCPSSSIMNPIFAQSLSNNCGSVHHNWTVRRDRSAACSFAYVVSSKKCRRQVAPVCTGEVAGGSLKRAAGDGKTQRKGLRNVRMRYENG